MITDFVQSLTTEELIYTYGSVINELKSRNVIRSKNVIGDLGEYLAIDYYCKTKGLPKLQPAPTGTKNIDAISINGERYSIKSTTGNVTGVFYGLNPPDSSVTDTVKFEYVIVVLFDANFKLKRINEINWEQFLRYKKWHSRMNAWNLTITRELLDNTRTIYNKYETGS
ncbi:hypothetical protein [Brevibacillus brevis]|uniref:hypothetical protein n=1 Tax=Brevibacillus brevis TaxID=1393 RepID=UPI000B3901BF|nr:hypothetical protein [Brevibacillus brevis]